MNQWSSHAYLGAVISLTDSVITLSVNVCGVALLKPRRVIQLSGFGSAGDTVQTRGEGVYYG